MMNDAKPKWFNERYTAVLFLGFSSGMPLMLIGSTLQAWYTSAGVSLMTIGILTLVGQPYLYKFLWAPFFDRFVPLPFGRRRSWILLMQLFLGLSLFGMAFCHPDKMPWLLASLALLVAFFSASQDIAIDAYRTDILPDHERSFGASLATIGYRLAMLLTGAIALIMAANIGWKNTYLVMGLIMLIEVVITYFAPEPNQQKLIPQSLQEAIILPLSNFFKRPYALIIIIFIVTYKLCDAIGLSLNTVFLLRYMGFSLTEVGVLSKTVGLISSLVGSLLGGILLPYLGLYRSLLCFGVLQLISLLPFAGLAVVGHNYQLLFFSVSFENLASSLSTISLIVLLMKLCDHRYTATQYALFSALISVGRVFVGPIAALLVEKFGWFLFYMMSSAAGIPALLIIIWLQRKINLFGSEKIVQDVLKMA